MASDAPWRRPSPSSGSRPTSWATAAAPSIWRLDIELVADNRIYVSGMGMESEWRADNLHARGTTASVDPKTGERIEVELFVAVMGASNYTYACATARQTTADWIGAQVRALEFFGGSPRLIVPDQARALIKRPDRRTHATSPRWRTPCWWSAGSWRGCGGGPSRPWASSIGPSRCCWSS